METLFDTSPYRITSEDVNSLPGLTPHEWLLLQRFLLTDNLGDLVRLLSRHYDLKSQNETLEFLIKEIVRKDSSNGTGRITWSDIQTSHTPRNLRLAINEALGKDISTEMDEVCLYRTLGTFSHGFVKWLEGHRWIFREGPKEIPSEDTRQFSMWGREKSSAPLLPNTLFELNLFSQPSKLSLLDLDLVARIQILGTILGEGGDDRDAFPNFYPKHTKEIDELWKEMGQLSPFHVQSLRKFRANALGEYLTFVTLLEWTRLVAYFFEKMPLAPSAFEIPVFPRGYGIQAGRIDELTISHPKACLGNLDLSRFKSAYEILGLTHKLFGPEWVNINDWKFAVGDNRNSQIRREQIPLLENFDQVNWYRLWLSLGHHLKYEPDHEWPNGNTPTGSLTYVMPSGTPIVIPVDTPSEKFNDYFRRIVGQWGKTKDNRVLREGTNRIVQAVRQLTARENVGRKFSSRPVEAKELFEQEPAPIISFIERQRKFVDQGFLIEMTAGKNGENRLLLHVDRLQDAIKRREVTMERGFRWDRGGKICCLLHSEKTPSMSISLKRGFFHCFGCGAKGGFAMSSIPAELVGIIGSDPLAFFDNQVFEEQWNRPYFGIPDEHREIMQYAQECLQGAFAGSNAPAYLQDKRSIDPDLAYQYGAGYGNDLQVIGKLLRQGYTVEKLFEYGFIGYSPYVPPNSSFTHFLRRRHLSEKEIQLEVSLKGRKDRWYPYSALNERLTFPLEIPTREGPVIVSFYGRDIQENFRGESKRNKHAKLAIDPELPQGLFNGRALCKLQENSMESSDLYVTEAALDALVLVHMEYGPVVGLNALGDVKTEYFLRKLVTPSTTLHLALDFDDGGRKGTERLTAQLSRYGMKVNDFSKLFSLQHDEVELSDDPRKKPVIDDYAKWWRECGRDSTANPQYHF